MPVIIDWENPEHTLLCVRFSGKWTLDDYYQAASTVYAMMNTVPHTVHRIIDTSESSQMLPGNLLSAALKAHSNVPQNAGVMVIVGSNLMIRKLVQIGEKLGIHAIQGAQFAETMDAAYTMLAQLHNNIES